MKMRAAINGYGRIGRSIVRALYEYSYTDFDIVAINDYNTPESIVHLTRYDTTHGRFRHEVSYRPHTLCIDGHDIVLLHEHHPEQLPWRDLNIDIVFECSGRFTHRNTVSTHLRSGAKKVLVSAPCQGADQTIVYGINHHCLSNTDLIVSNASCTTNCLAQCVYPIHEKIGILSGMMNTVHSYTNDQSLLDSHHKDLRRTRSATQSMIPTTTGAIRALEAVFPDLVGCIDGFAIRVPTINVSLVDFSFVPAQPTGVEDINALFKTFAKHHHPRVLINEEPLVSTDFNHCSASAILDLTLTRATPQLVKVCAWYDNEWGFANRMLDTARHMLQHAT